MGELVRTNVMLSADDRAWLHAHGGPRGGSEILRDLIDRKRRAGFGHRIKVPPPLWAAAVARSRAQGLTPSEYLCTLLEADLRWAPAGRAPPGPPP